MRCVARKRRLLLGIVALLASTAPVLAQNDRVIVQLNRAAPPSSINVPASLPSEAEIAATAVDPTVRELVTILDDASYEAREEAMRTLADLQVDVRQLCAVLSSAELSSEQRYRLVLLLRRQLLYAPRGAVGIRMEAGPALPDGSPPGVRVIEVIEGLPAVGVLQPADRITHIDGVPIRFQGDLQILVQSKTPGSVINLRVRRPRLDDRGQRMDGADGLAIFDQLELSLPLGSADLLVDPLTGLPTGASRVRQARTREAEEAYRRYAPEPRHVDLADARPELLGPPPTAGRFADLVLMTKRSVQTEIERLDDRRFPMPSARRAQLIDLVRQARDLAQFPEVTEQDRRELRRLADRLEEKMTR